jgi:putative ABC transport system permease protein
MFRNYIKIGWRNLTRNKSYAFINIFGLSLGIACSIVIYAFVSYQLSFDTFHKNKDRVYRLVTEWHDDEVGHSAAVPSPLGKAFRNEYTYAEQTARVIDYNDVLIAIPGGKELKKFNEESGVVYTEPAFFDILDFPLLKGDKKTFLKNPNSAAITEKLAKKYFGSEDPMGKTIRVNNHTDFIITGVLKDLPPNTDRRQEIYLSYDNLKAQSNWIANDSSWGGVYSGSQCYVLLKPNVKPEQVSAGLKQLVMKNYTGRDQKVWFFKLQPLNDVHFNTDFDGEADKKYLWAFFFIGLFLIITACVNFINLATAQALNRSKEIGIRKVLGSLPSQLFWQFISETALITLFAIVLAFGFAYFALPFVNGLFQTEITLHLFSNAPLLLFLLLIGVLVTFLSGSYPGLILARFQPVLCIKKPAIAKNTLADFHCAGFWW